MPRPGTTQNYRPDTIHSGNIMKAAILKKTSVLIVVFSAIAFSAGPGFTYDFVVVQSSAASHYEKAVAGFRTTAIKEISGRGMKIAVPDSLIVWTLGINSPSGTELKERIIDRKPDVVVAVGRKALLELMQLPEIPVVYLMVRDGEQLAAEYSHITGINMVIPPARQLAAIGEALPTVKRIGVIHSPESRSFINKAAAVAALQGQELISAEARNSKQVVKLLDRMVNKVDGFWMQPDPKVTTSNTLEAMLHFSIDNHIPLLAFADKYLELGAMMALSFDILEMGAQAGRLARVAAKTPHKLPPPEPPKKIRLRLNNKIAAKMGVRVNTAALDN